MALGITAVLLLWRAIRSLWKRGSDGRWFAPGEMAGFAWPWIFACLFVIPTAVYVATYIPWLELGHAFAIADVGPGYGWSLDELHAQMFGYHFGLQAGHPASSPWWSWPLDLKPVWFYSHSFDFDRWRSIYNGGNPVLFWASVPAILVAPVPGLAPPLVGAAPGHAAFAFQYLPWTRVERATFHYHYLTAVMFAFIAVAYLLDEVLRDRTPASTRRSPSWSRPGSLGLLIFPLGSALAMPDWYVNAARALPPWNYAFQFPGPPKGERPPLISDDPIVLMVATAALARRGRVRLVRAGPARAGPSRPSAGAADGGEEDDDPDRDQPDRPQEAPVEAGDELPGEGPAADQDEDRA